jgi:RNA polymerase sigma-70 factor (ECF subfamily)
MFQPQSLIDEMGSLRKFALRLTKNTHEAEDLVQATLLRALEKKDYFQENTNLFSWTSKIMFNLFVSSYRQKKKFETQYDPTPYIEQVSIGPTQEANVDLVTVSEGMQLLSPGHREILMLVCVQGMRYEDASAHLGIPVGTVRSRLSRARKQLQDILTEKGRSDIALPPAVVANAANEGDLAQDAA